jgi:hypothetical protein
MERSLPRARPAGTIYPNAGRLLLAILGVAVLLVMASGSAIAQDSGAAAAPDAAQAAPASVDPFRLAIARWDDITVGAYSAHSNAVEKYPGGDREAGEALIFTVGSIHHSIAKTAHADWLVALDGMIGRGLIMLGDRDGARQWLESALRTGEAGGNTDEDLSGVLRDLAWLASQRGDVALAENYVARADVCPLPCASEMSWLVSQESEKFAAEAREILGSGEFWRRRAEEQRRAAEAFVGEHFGETSTMMARFLQKAAGEIEPADPAALALIERAIRLFRQSDTDASMSLSALRKRLEIVEASGDAARAIDLAGEIIAEAAMHSEKDRLRIALAAAEKRFRLLLEAGSSAAALAYADAVRLAIWSGADAGPGFSLVKAGVEAGFYPDARRLADRLILDPHDDAVLGLQRVLGERLGDAAEVERLNAMINPPPGRKPTDREIALARLDRVARANRYLISGPEDFAFAPKKVDQTFARFWRQQTASFHTAMSRSGRWDDILLAEALIALGYLAGRQFDEAESRYAAVLAEGEQRGWSEARLSSIVSHLAFLAERRGDVEAAEDLRERAADACVAPCPGAVFHETWVELRSARRLIETLSTSADERREVDRYHEDAIAYFEASSGEAAPEVVDLLKMWASSVRDRNDRPWQSIELHRQLIEKRLAQGEAATETLDIRRTILEELLKAGEYRRLVDYAEPLIADARTVGNEQVLAFAALNKARALWHLGDAGARAAYGEVIAMLRAPDAVRKVDAGLLLHLVDARYGEEILEVADLLLEAEPESEFPLIAKARVAADRGDYLAAAELLARIAQPSRTARLQQAYFLGLAGQTERANALRAATPPMDFGIEEAGVQGAMDRFKRAINPWTEINGVIDPRDFGADEGAAAAALDFLPRTEEWIEAGQYVHAQMLWQIAFTLARGGESTHAFRLMREAASIAIRHSFHDANDTDGGSLQLMRRDKFRFLLFVEIAWANVSGQPPASMSMSSRY